MGFLNAVAFFQEIHGGGVRIPRGQMVGRSCPARGPAPKSSNELVGEPNFGAATKPRGIPTVRRSIQ
jgi:hypothetical protein